MKIKKKNTNFFIKLLMIIFLILFVFSVYNIITWVIDSNKTNDQMANINDNVNVNEIDDTSNTEIIKSTNKDKFDPYWDYIKMNLINVNFNKLKAINNQTKGWIQVKGTNINYPFVQTNNNKYYLSHSFDQSYNDAGWVFQDYRNKLDGSDKNSIIYAHSRYDKSMFGSLRNILNSGWLDNSNNHIIKLSTEYENTLWQVFSVYHIPTTSDYLQTTFYSDANFKQFTDMLTKRSAYNFNTSVNKSDRILTLSTCYDSTDKVVLHAKLIKREIR